MTFANPSDAVLTTLLETATTFAVIGASQNSARPVYGVMERLLARGYRVIPINPGLAGQEILGQTVVARLADAPAPVDIVDIFRTSDAALGIVEEAIAEKDRLGLKAVWMQIGVINPVAARRAADAGLTVVMDLCPKIEIARLGIERLGIERLGINRR